mgnify:CR=1 FL=1
MPSKTWFITGTSRGIGLEIARAALAAGHAVAATSRRRADVTAALGAQANLLALDLDVVDTAAIGAAVHAAEARFGGIDVLVNNAGYGHMGMFEETTEAEMRAQFETNVFGLMNVTRAVLPGMRARRRGHVMNMSSVAGVVGFTAASLYCASKFAVDGFSLTLAGELKDLGIQVTIVAPGFIRTDFLDKTSLKTSPLSVPDYADTSAQIRATFDSYNQKRPGDAVRLAGSDALQMTQARLAAAQAELDGHRELSASVDGQWG